MSTATKIDFEPGLFDEGQYEEAPDLPAIQPKRRTNRTPFIVAGGLLLVLAAAFFAINTTRGRPSSRVTSRHLDHGRSSRVFISRSNRPYGLTCSQISGVRAA